MARNRPPSFQFYPRDFRSDSAVDAMTFDQRGRYVWALCASWESASPGTAGEEQWRLWMKYTPKQWVNNRDIMSQAFSQDDAGNWIQKRMVEEREAQRVRYEQAAKGARIANAQRADSGRYPPAPASASASASLESKADGTQPPPRAPRPGDPAPVGGLVASLVQNLEARHHPTPAEKAAT